jgi:predicted lipid-binding transport protein (Tim44 family)
MEKPLQIKSALTIATAVILLMFFLLTGFLESADARARRGGRTFKKAPAVSQPAVRQTPSPGVARPMGSPFARGLAGGIMGGFLGSMLFGGMAHGAGTGGFGGSGIGLIEILLLGGLGYFLYRKFIRPKVLASQTGPAFTRQENPDAGLFPGAATSRQVPEPPEDDPLVAGVRDIWAVDSGFDPDGFKETAQDLFFKVQAGWTRRDATILKPYVGDQLLNEYAREFESLKQQGRINRLENIAMRHVDLIAAGVQDKEKFVTVRFTANLLDYTVDETSGEVLEGDAENAVKFQEDWTFAAPVGTQDWKLEGIDG